MSSSAAEKKTTDPAVSEKKIAGLHRNVFFTGLVSLFMDFSSEMIYPLVPIFLSSVLGVNKSVIGLIEGIAESSAALTKVFSGWFSDLIGKRKILLIIGYGISTLSRPLIAVSTTWHQVLTFRFVDRVGKGIRGAPRDAIIAESSRREHIGRSFGFQRAMDTFGAVLGPSAAFVILTLAPHDYRLVFWLSAIPGAIAVLVIIAFIREKRPAAAASGRPVLSLKTFDWRFKAFVAITFLFAAGNSSDVFLVLKASSVGVKGTHIPLLYLAFNGVYALTSYPAGVLSDRIGRKRIILAGFILFGFVYWGFAAAADIPHIWGLFLLYGVFMGLTEGVQKAYLGTIIPDDAKATGYGIYNTAVGLAAFPASVIAGQLWDRIGPSAVFYYGSAAAFVAAILFMIIFGLDAWKKEAQQAT
ncbi:MAG: MFS transporter [Nitrospiraceae bacterium]|nr:MFS transporter [Nitrospiraceae bacterium]